MRRYIFLSLILLGAFWLRVHDLPAVPPGLTHDEANHGREGISILAGDLRLYYPLNYGSEPLYSYTVAASMAAVGRNLFALRFVGVMFGVLMVAAAAAWSTRAFNRPIGYLTAAALAVGYWPLVAGRMALRATLLPFFTLLAVWFFRRMVQAARHDRIRPHHWLLFGLFVGTTFYIYLASRVLWLVYPLFVGYLLWRERPTGRRLVVPTLLGLVLGGLLSVPMFIYLKYNPEASTRLSMLDGNLQAVLDGNLWPILENSYRAVLALFWPGAGDQFLAYNIPGRPTLAPFSAVLAGIGLLAAVINLKKPAYAFALLWLAVGLIPSLITGPTANTTRNIGMMPVLYLLPALGVWHLALRLTKRSADERAPRLAGTLGLIWLALTAGNTYQTYFVEWANRPDVRAAYQTTIIAALDQLEQQVPADEAAVVSTVYPGAAHDVSIAQVMLDEKDRPLRWADGRFGLILPTVTEPIPVYAAASADLHPHFRSWAQSRTVTDMRPTDTDPYVAAYRLQVPAVPAQPTAVFGADAIALHHTQWLAPQVPAGGVAELLTVWRVRDPSAVGPIVPPIETTDVVLFTHLLRPSGTILAQADRLDAPSWRWQTGDTVMQIHQLYIPPETVPETYTAVVGLYDRQSGRRLPRRNADDASMADAPSLQIVPPAGE